MMNDHLQQLLNLYASGTLTEDQRLELARLLDNEEAAEQFAGLVRQQLSGGELPIAADLSKTEDKIVQGVLKKIQSAPVIPVHRSSFLRKWGWAAAAILIISIGAYRWFAAKNTSSSMAGDNKHLQNDIGPGGDKAVLTLADGTTISLDSAATGAIARQGSASIVKQANGQLAYHLNGATEGALMMNTMRTPRGGQYRLVLPDGTQVWLNAASSISYPAVFAGKERKVSISGEVYFEVAKNREKPFIVHIDGQSSIEVLGTRFNVNSYTNEHQQKTTLLEGSVKISIAGTPAQQAILTPGQQAQVSRQRLSVVGNADIDRVMAWKNGLFNFNDAGVEEVMRQLERWYDVEVVYENGVPNLQFEGEISRNIKLSDLLKVLARAELKFRLEEGKRLVVLP